MSESAFESHLHTLTGQTFSEVVNDAVTFFAKIPDLPLQSLPRFVGSGVYALYYVGKFKAYENYSLGNMKSRRFPIYVGKAVPTGWRQGRQMTQTSSTSTELFRRLSEHASSIGQTSNILVTDFNCRFMIFDEEASDMISTVESALIRKYRPLWNSALDGFGNHDPGKGRYEQAKSDWDVLHPGRKWAERLNGTPRGIKLITSKVHEFMKGNTSESA